MIGVPTVSALRRRHLGAPDSLRATLRRLADDAALPRVTRREYARALATMEPPEPERPGVVPFVVVVPGTTEGVVYRAVAADGWRADLSPVPPDLAGRVRRFVEAALPELTFAGLHLHVTGPAPGDGWDGRSCELALAAAAVSWATQRPAAHGAVATGALGEGQRVVAVGHLPSKAAVVARDLPEGLLVAPTVAEAAFFDLLDAIVPGWHVAAAAIRASSAGRRAREAQEALEARRHAAALELATRAEVDAGDDAATRARAAWVRGSALLHLGRADEGLEALDAARVRLPAWEEHAEDPAEDLTAEELEAHTLVALLDTGRVRAAWLRGQAALERLRRTETRTRRWRWVALQVAGSTHRAALALGDLAGATDLLQAWNLGRALLVDQRARALGDLAEVHRRGGRLPEARRFVAEARGALVEAHDPGHATARYLALFDARIDADLRRPTPPARPAGPVWPELGFRLLATRAGVEDLGTLHGLAEVRASFALQWVVAAEVVWHALHDGPGAAVLEASRRDLARWTVDDTDLAELVRRLADDPAREDLQELRRRSPYG